MKRAIITGCTGAVGVSIIQELLLNDWGVIAVCRENSTRRSSIPQSPQVRIIECDLEKMENLAALIEQKCDVFYHLAWDGTYGVDRMDCIRQNKNVEYTLQAVRTAKELGCEVFIGAGSQSEYGNIDDVIRPDIVCKPNNPYGAAKLAACHMSRVLCNQLGIRHNWCRILSLYGADDGTHTMVSTIITKLLKGERPICTAGDQIWDYIYSKDAARAFRLVAESGKEDAVYCLGSGQTRTLRQYIEAIRDMIDPRLEIGFGELPYYPNQVMHLEADITNLTADTGFVPQYTFEEGIRETIEWCKKTEKD